MRNSSIIVTIVGISILISGVVAAAVMQNYTFASIVALVSLALVASSQLLSTLSTKSETDILIEHQSRDEEIRAIYDRFRQVERDIEDTAARNHRYYDEQIDDIYRRLDDTKCKK